MSVVTAGLLALFLFYAVFLLVCLAVLKLLPGSLLARPAKAMAAWLPPFLGGDALRKWAATTAESLVRQQLSGERNSEVASRLAKAVEEGAMRAMVPLADPAELDRVLACPETGQGRIGVTAPEVLAIADYLRKNKSPEEVRRIHELAVENAEAIAARAESERDQPPLPCPLQGKDHVCCVYSMRPLHCRPLHAICLGMEMGHRDESGVGLARHEQIVAQGVELGLTQALKSAGLDGDAYELNSALATALGTPDAAERWAKGEHLFRAPLSLHWSSGAGARSPSAS